MPATKNQQIRLEILDELLSFRKWTLEELLERVNGKIVDTFTPITSRTLFRDINYLIEKKDAPIHRPERNDNFYYYTERFSLKNIPLDEDELVSLKNAVQILKQVDNFVTYHPYTHPKPADRIAHPYLLKEFRNRWFLLGREGNSARVTNYALDRIKKIRPSNDDYIENDLFDPAQYFNHLIGVSVPEGAKPENIEIKVHKQAAPYVLSKPIHFNQQTLKKYKDGSILVKLHLIINHELKSILLSYGPGLEIKKPNLLREDIKLILDEMLMAYDKS